ncbi:MAG TPA: 4Fe-4S dicluster domain-containing protein [Bacteroidales bacterium]|nr:4Fe-4S dicluster domain-containing protein [Bacteroidales bacterium]HPS17780.1 4Fe-4S dicluster domain-containing protein [Bacteroidales bacterium]
MTKDSLLKKLSEDIRYQEGLTACINCGTCTAICPAAQFYDYDPRMVADTLQHKDEAELEALLKGDTIWMCGECLSCKTRCPRSNVPGYLIQALRALSIETGFFAESEKGRQQLAIKRTVGEHILQYGYCVHIDEVNTQMYPEQGPVWDWLKLNRETILKKLGANYNENGAGTLRKTSDESMNDLRNIFRVTGAIERFDKIEKYSEKKASELGIQFSEGKDNDYFRYVYSNEKPEEQ